MIAMNYLKGEEKAMTTGFSDCFSLVTSQTSASGVRCSWIEMNVMLPTGASLVLNMTADMSAMQPLPKIDGCTIGTVHGPQYDGHCNAGFGNYTLLLFVQKTTDVVGTGAAGPEELVLQHKPLAAAGAAAGHH